MVIVSVNVTTTYVVASKSVPLFDEYRYLFRPKFILIMDYQLGL